MEVHNPPPRKGDSTRGVERKQLMYSMQHFQTVTQSKKNN